MKLLGLYLFPEGEAIYKVLKAGWYPFGSYEAPNENMFVDREKFIPDYIENIYTTTNGPHISVNAIVGKNGSGKSALIEMLFRVINNFAKYLLGSERSKNDYRQLSYAHGVYADLYFETGSQQYLLSCKGLKVFLYKVYAKKQPVKIGIRNSSKANSILQNFFYTIVTNYSIYSYNESDYGFEAKVASNKNIKGGEWLSGLFHKNDGYFTPLVITPFRDDGSMDIDTESHLARERIVKLSLLAELNGKQLLPNYQPDELIVTLMPNLSRNKKDNVEKKLKKISSLLNYQLVHDAITKGWEKHLRKEFKGSFLPYKYKGANKNILNIALKYLAYKTLKVALNYKDYADLLKLKTNRSELHEDPQNFYENTLPNATYRLIEKITKEFNQKGEHNHLTLKIEQTYRFIERFIETGVFEWQSHSKIKVSDLLRPYVNRAQELNYTSIYTLLPPPVFNVDIRFRRTTAERESDWNFGKQDSLTLSMLSSGERQLLYSLSYVLYHIKNLESIRDSESRVSYRNICLIFDEVELYFHPEFQRGFIARLIEAIQWCHIDRKVIESIQILLVTHSPFVLTDIFTHNTLYLNSDGTRVKVQEETFGANYYTLLNKSFFFDKSAVGPFSTRFMRDMFNNENIDDKQTKDLLEFLGDRFIASYILSEKGVKKDV